MIDHDISVQFAFAFLHNEFVLDLEATLSTFATNFLISVQLSNSQVCNSFSDIIYNKCNGNVIRNFIIFFELSEFYHRTLMNDYNKHLCFTYGVILAG